MVTVPLLQFYLYRHFICFRITQLNENRVIFINGNQRGVLPEEVETERLTRYNFRNPVGISFAVTKKRNGIVRVGSAKADVSSGA